MPYKFNVGRRDKFKRAKYRVTNWPEYNESLRRRGDLTVWFDASMVEGIANLMTKADGVIACS